MMQILTNAKEIERVIRPYCKQETIDWIRRCPEHPRRLEYFYGTVELIINEHGFALYAISNHVFLHLIYVSPQSRQKGHGKKLFTRLLERVQELHKDKLVFSVEQNNIQALDFYKSFGYLPKYHKKSRYHYEITFRLEPTYNPQL